MMLWIGNVEIRKVDVLVSLLASECHDDIDKDPDAVLVTGLYQRHEVGVRCGRSMALGEAEFIVGGQEMRRVVPHSRLKKLSAGGNNSRALTPRSLR
jgi:hypothetical protein